MSFNNLYYKRAAGTAKACFVCYKPTTTVLATINTVDFVYTCPGHLADPGFATLVKDEAKGGAADVSPEEIAKVKAEWEEKQKAKKEKDKEDNKDKSQKGKESDKGREGKDTDKEKKEPKLSNDPAPASKSYERYILHRHFFAMRQAEHQKRRQVTQAKDLAPRLPSAPTGSI